MIALRLHLAITAEYAQCVQKYLDIVQSEHERDSPMLAPLCIELILLYPRLGQLLEGEVKVYRSVIKLWVEIVVKKLS